MMVALGQRSAGSGQRETSRPAPGTYPTSVQLTNLSRPGSPFQLGDRFRLTVTGDPGQEVQVDARHNGEPSTMVFGTTDSSGVLVIRDTMKSEHIGSWSQNWFVGSRRAGALVFDVDETKPAVSETNGRKTDTNGGPVVTTDSETPMDFRFPSTLFGLPLWMVAAGVGGILLLKGK